MIGRSKDDPCMFCAGATMLPLFSYTSPPPREIRFSFAAGQEYFREIVQCATCLHCFSTHRMDLTALYGGDYVASNYGDVQGIHATFERVMKLPPERSDNVGRCRFLNEFAQGYGARMNLSARRKTLLDVGSGTGVFPFAMKEHGWQCTALDPDPAAVRHLRELLALNCIQGDFATVSISEKFELITFNKVLEHVAEPVELLKHAVPALAQDGLIYVEVPDGEIAALHGKDREEFTIDHLHNFSAASLALLVKQAGLRVLHLERLHEPSTKFTLRVMCIR